MDSKQKSSKVTDRIQCLDVLRGFDMFWIVGGGTFVLSLIGNTKIEWLNKFALQFEHATWEGFRFWDLIFPLFMFISGAVIPYSILTKIQKGISKSELIIKTIKRMMVLVVLGIIYNGTLRSGFAEIRYVSVLGQIGIAYFFSVLIVLYTKQMRSRLFWLAGILVLIAVLQLFIPVPGFGAGVITPEGCINSYIDRLILPGRLAYNAEGMISGQGIYDALGIISTFSSIGITLSGVFAGFILKSTQHSELKKFGVMSVIGVVLIFAAILINPVYPVIKNCWTSTYTLLAGGISFLLVSISYLLIDVWGLKRYFFFFQVIGLNPLFIYLFYRIVNVNYSSQFLFRWIAIHFAPEAEKQILAFGSIVLIWGILYFLYKKQIFIKI